MKADSYYICHSRLSGIYPKGLGKRENDKKDSEQVGMTTISLLMMCVNYPQESRHKKDE
jgi:hypothetical protein